MKYKQINEILSMVKLVSLLFSGIALYIFFIDVNGGDLSNIITPLYLTVILLVIYLIWNSVSNIKFRDKSVKLIQIIETYLFVCIFFIVILYTGGYESDNKFLFLFIIIISTIQRGMAFGMSTAMTSAALVLGMDILCFQELEVNPYFQSDLVIVTIFVMTAWLIGHYVNIEKEYFEKMENLAHIDELSGLNNHRYFNEKLVQLIKESDQDSPLSMMFLDIDNFKAYNDLYGHQQGDNVIVEFSAILKKNVDEGNILARYGGDEFGILLPNTREEAAILIAERIRSSVEEKTFEGEERIQEGKITVSVGVTVYPQKSESRETLLKSADDALYRAKFFSKNRVEAYTSTLDALKNDIEDSHIDFLSSIKTFITIINSKDRYTFGHVERVVVYAKLLSEKLKINEKDKKTLIYGAYMHDLGKINIPEEVLNKQMPLTDEEWDMIKEHPYNGVKIIEPVVSLKPMIPLIMHHHEKYDGTGYPSNLKGEEIPYLARIMNVIDAFDAMTFKRSYKQKMTYEQAKQELKDCSYSQFDPDIVKEFIEVIDLNKDDFY